MLRQVGLDHRILRDKYDLIFVVRHCSADYIRPARLDDLLHVETCPKEPRGARLEMKQRILCGTQELVCITVEAAILSTQFRPKRLPGEIRQAFLTGLGD